MKAFTTMIRLQKKYVLLVLQAFMCLSVFALPAAEQEGDTLRPDVFLKKELNSGFMFYRYNGRESISNGLSDYTEQRSNYNAYYNLSFNSWDYLDFLQEKILVNLGVGPFYSSGESTRKAGLITTSLNQDIYGLSLYGDMQFSGRYYYDTKNYALVEARGYGRFEEMKIYSEGWATPEGSGSLGAQVDESEFDNRLRYGVDAKAGAGFGKVIPMNHRMQAEYLLNKFYRGKLFSENEKIRVASAIAVIKNNRNLKEGHDSAKEREKLKKFLKKRMILKLPDSPEGLWQYGEFLPRFSGKRFEIGPLFSYYNKEPDFVYGGFARYESFQYKNYKTNINFSSELSYNVYKQRDWLLWENSLQLDYYANLRSLFSIGVKYVPGVVVNDFKDIGPIQHALIPYLEYYRQLNDKHRISLAFSYRIADDNDFFTAGPEFSLSFYRSRY